MKNLQWIYLIIALLALIANDAAWARGGHGGGHSGGGHGGGHSGGGHGGGHSIGGGGGHRHAGGGHRRFGGGHRHSGHRHSHHRSNFGIRLGGYYNPGFYGGGYYRNRGYGYGGFGYRGYGGYGYRGYPSTVIVPSTPPVYIQREVVTPVQQQTNYWHYCREQDGYYPYIKQCPGGWLQVAPQPPAS
jgi:hypothetical protein